VKFSSVISIQIFSLKNANPSINEIHVENDYFPLPSKFEMNNIKILLEDTLSSGVFRLHVTYSDGHNAAVGGVIDMASHGCPFLDTLHMVEHHPSILKITTWLHPFY
jgi:hypothetical protein